MTEKARATLHFRAGSLEMVVVGLLTLAGALVATWTAITFRFVDCANEASSECSSQGQHQLVVALVGLVPALGTLVASIRKRGRPWRWFLATLVFYAVWGLLAWRWAA